MTYNQTETQEGQTVTTETEKLENGGTVTNKLSDKVEFSVSAEWIAAARQGGTASATYQLQRKMSGAADWVPVLDKNGNNMERTLTFDELHMKREGDETCIFEEVDLYDEHGNLYEYRVVQTSVTRKDELPAGDNTPQQPNTNDTDIPCESEGGAVDIEVNDKYRVVTSVDGTDFHFQYNIEGDTKVNIHKITNTFADETDITVHKRWADNTNAENTRTDLFLKLHRRSARPGATEEDSRKEYEWRKSELDSDNEWSYTFSGLPKYDDDGYPYTYYVTEQDPTRLPGYKQIYQTNAPYKYNGYGTPTQEKNEKVYLDPSLLRNDVAYDGGIITNRLYGELTINGEKWTIIM